MTMPIVRASELIHRITLLAPQQVMGAAGNETSWVTFREKIPAKIAGAKATEKNAVGQTTAEVTKTITIRYIPGVTPDMRVRTASGDYEIALIDNVEERNIRLDITCTIIGRKR